MTGPRNRVDACASPSPVRRHFVARRCDRAILTTPRVNRQHEDLVAKASGNIREQLRPRDRGRVDTHFIRARAQESVNIVGASDPAAHGQRHKDLLGRAPHDIKHRVAVIGGGAHIKERHLIGALHAIASRKFDGVSGISQVRKVHTLDNSPRVHVEARNHANGDRHGATSGVGDPLAGSALGSGRSRTSSAVPETSFHTSRMSTM